ncbi:alpha/beta fold hydrolase [Streptomyces sp. NPDC051286]|uniref:alpha/beta fold hydrolase n=1 Tax=Streptomyces sp. NPDC051286 TaxID=3365647 RepID=UPI003795E711
MPYITAGHDDNTVVELYYEDHGTGQPVVLIHDYPLDGRSWHRQVPPLLAAGHRVITYDRRGFGRSSHAAEGYDYDSLAADLDALLTGLDLTETVLVGHAAGTGEITRYLGTYDAARVAKAVFLAGLGPYLLRTEETPYGIELSAFDVLIAEARRDPQARFAELRRDFFNTDENLGTRFDAEAAKAFLDIAAAASPRAAVAVIPTWITDFRTDIAAIDVPVLIVHGTHDRLLPIDATSRPLHALLPRAVYVEIPAAPHGLLWTHADEVNRALLDFLGEGTASRPAAVGDSTVDDRAAETPSHD